jgi:hypothetical protein
MEARQIQTKARRKDIKADPSTAANAAQAIAADAFVQRII